MPAAEEIEIRPEHYQRLTEKIAGKPEERIVSYLMLRSLRKRVTPPIRSAISR